MSDTPAAEAKIGHNRGAVVAPFETDLLEDLKTRYPNVEPKFDELVATAKTVPDEFTDDETAGKVQELLRNMTDSMRRWKADRTAEKGPWQKLADLAFGFFKDKEDKLKIVHDDIKLRHTKFLQHKADEEERRREAKAEEERKKAEAAQAAAREAEMDQLWAEAHEELARFNEAAAKKRADDAREDQMWAEARKELADYDARKAEERRQELEDKSRREVRTAKRELKAATTEANGLGKKDEAGELTDDEKDRYRALIGKNGVIATLQAKIADGGVAFLSDDEQAELARETENLARLQTERVANHQKAEEAKAARQKAQTEARTAGKDAQEHAADARVAGRELNQATKEAERQDARAGRAERQVSNASDADLSRTRSTLGTVGSLSGRWAYVVEDRDALTKHFGPLGMYLTSDAQDGAVYRWMRENQGTFTVTPTRSDQVPGVFFENVPESRIK